MHSHTGRRRRRIRGGCGDGDGGRKEVVEEKRSFAPNADVRVWAVRRMDWCVASIEPTGVRMGGLNGWTDR